MKLPRPASQNPKLPRPASQNPGEDWAYAMARELVGKNLGFVAKKLRQIADAIRGLQITCDFCRESIIEPGALLFSPPDRIGTPGLF